MDKSMIEKEITMTKFLALFYHVNPAQARHITHADASKLFSNLESMDDYEFHTLISNEDKINYVKVKDKNNKIMYYKKKEIEYNEMPEECTDFEFLEVIDEKNLISLLIVINDVDIEHCEKWELCELKKKLKCLKKIYGNYFDVKISDIGKQLRKRKRVELNDKYKRK